MNAGERSQFGLLAERRFGPFFGVQFLGAFNDNVFKQALVILIAFHAGRVRGPRAGGDGEPRGRALHPALLSLLRHRRAARRQVRQGADHPPGQGARDRDHGDRGGRVHPARRGPAARGALPARVPLDPVRAGEVRDPAPGAARTGARRRQRAGRDRHVARDPRRHHPRRPADRAAVGARAPRAGRDDRGRGARLRGQPLRAARAAAAGRSRDRLESVHRDLAQPRVHPRGTARCSCRSSACRGSGSSAP